MLTQVLWPAPPTVTGSASPFVQNPKRQGRVFLALIGYGAEDVRASRLRLSRILARVSPTLPIETVDTATNSETSSNRDINEAFEFSGYAYALKNIIDAAQDSGSAARSSDAIYVVFLNSTALTSHLSEITTTFVRYIVAIAQKDESAPALIGLRWSATGPIKEVAALGFYFATFLFCVRGTAEQLSGCAFYDPRDVRRFRDGNFDSLPPSYSKGIIDWLNPRDIFSGWYKSSPFVRISESEMMRKRIAIFCEHSLAQRFVDRGFSIVAVNDESSHSANAKLRRLLFFDRIYVNLLKLRNRVSHLVSFVLAKYLRHGAGH